MSNQLVCLTRENLSIIEIICNSLGWNLVTRIRACAAKLIFYFNRWRNWKLANHRTEWIYMPLKQIREDLLFEHSIHVIRSAIELMIAGGILERRGNPGNKQDRTYQYCLKVDSVASLATTVEKDNSSEDGEFRSESPEFIVEKSVTTEDPTQKSDPNETDARVFSDRQEKVDQTSEKPQKKEKTASDPEIDWQVYNHLLGELEGTGIPKTKQLEQYLRKSLKKWGAAAAARVRDAIAAFKQAKNIQNPGGWLITAIERGFKPNQPRSQSGDTSPEPLLAEPGRSPLPPSPAVPTPEQNPAPKGFTEWYELAKKVGLVTAHRDGVLTLPEGGELVWEPFANLYPIEKLRELEYWCRLAYGNPALGVIKARIEQGEVFIHFKSGDPMPWDSSLRRRIYPIAELEEIALLLNNSR